MDFLQKTSELLEGAYDLHIHASPSPFNRLLDAFEVVEQAHAAKMAGVLLKSHYAATGARAALVNNRLQLQTTKAYGALTLNHPIGGLNPYAVEFALKMGCSIVWMPTRDATNSLVMGDMPGDFFKRPGISIFDEHKKILPVVYEIMDIVKKYDAVLATGHLSPEESVALCREGRKKNITLVLTHPEFPRTIIPLATQCELADSGVIIEKCWYSIGGKECTAEYVAGSIQKIGADRCFMTSDRGQAGLESPVEAMKMFIEAMQTHAISDASISSMLVTVPRRLLRV